MNASSLEAQLRVEPPNWWTGMRHSNVQLMLHGQGLAEYTPTAEYPGVVLTAWHPGASPNYLFLDLQIGPQTKPGNLTLKLTHSEKEGVELKYPLLERSKAAEAYEGFDASDAIYLITPDRFANGDPGNDAAERMREPNPNRMDDYGRHGGDISGIIQNLDYIEEMGFTALWSCPLLTNDMPEASYHGYAITDFYEVDPRFGSMEEYKLLSSEAEKRGIKLIMDQVVNHCGLYHWWMEDLPFADWVHFQQDWLDGKPFTVTNHRRTVNQDPYASMADTQRMNRGWFVPSMPDLNQDNPFLARYLIQNSIWWIETLGLAGIRQDTYPYPDKYFMARWARTIMEEYPNFNIVGEEWSYNPLLVGYWQDGAHNRDGYQSYLRSTMDFPLQQTLIKALISEESWDAGFNILYEALANDFNYARPSDLLLFADNHDMDRLFTQVDESPDLAEMAMAFILMAPRIPQIYYGTEILMENSAKPGDHGLIRSEFPGGWPDAEKNAFTRTGLSKREARMQERMQRLLLYRKGSPALQKGQTLHFAPENGIYLLVRSLGAETVVLILNKNEKLVSLGLDRYSELGLQGKRLSELFSGDTLDWEESITLERRGAYVFTTRPD